MMEQITFYLQGRLREEKAMKLWKRLIVDDNAYQVFEFYYLITRLLSK